MNQAIFTFLIFFLTSCSLKQDTYKPMGKKQNSIMHGALFAKQNELQDKSLAQAITSLQSSTDAVLLLVPLSGDNGRIGKGILNACVMAAGEYFDNSIRFYIVDTADHALDENLLFSRFKDVNLKAIIGPVFYAETKKFGALFPNIPIFTFSNNLNANNNHVFACGLSPQDEIKQLLSYARTKKLNTFLIMLPNSKIGNDILYAIKEISQLSQFNDNNEYEVIRYNNISKEDATAYVNNSGKKAVFIIEPIINVKKLNKIQILTLSTPVLSNINAWRGSIFAFANSQKLNLFVRDYKNTFDISPNILDIIGYDITKAVYNMILQLRVENEVAFGEASKKDLDLTKEHKGCLGRFRFIRNKGLKRKLTLFQSE